MSLRKLNVRIGDTAAECLVFGFMLARDRASCRVTGLGDPKGYLCEYTLVHNRQPTKCM
jgi:hypothetical protein